MSDWNDKSNYEINKAVAKSYLTTECCFFFNKPDQQVLVEYDEEDGEALWEEFDPCTNIEDAWPIMKQYNIDVEWPDEGNCCGTVTRYMEGATDVQEDFTDKEDVLRCAMIVYLESEDVSCE